MMLVAGLLACSISAEAADIREQKHAYKYGDVVSAMEEGAFVVCDGCGRYDQLKKLPPARFFGIRSKPSCTELGWELGGREVV